MPFRNGVVTAPNKARNTAAGPGASESIAAGGQRRRGGGTKGQLALCCTETACAAGAGAGRLGFAGRGHTSSAEKTAANSSSARAAHTRRSFLVRAEGFWGAENVVHMSFFTCLSFISLPRRAWGKRGALPQNGERPAFFAWANTPQRRKRPASPFLCGRLCSLAALRRDYFSISSRAASLL